MIGQEQAAPLSSLAQAAAQRGVSTCLPSIDALANDLAARHNVGVFLFNRVENADANVVSISFELTPSPAGGSHYMSATFSPSGAGVCQAVIETVMVWQKGCVDAGLEFPGYRVAGRLLDNVQMLSADGATRLFLMPTPSGCISIEKTAFF